MDNHPNEERIRAFYEALSARDLDRVRQLVAQEAVMTIPGRSPIAVRSA